MDEFIKLVDAIVWPAVVLFLGFMFRKELRIVLTRLSKVKYKDLEANFERDLREVEAKAVELSQVHVAEPLTDELIASSHEQLSRIAEISPRAAIMEAWREVELNTMAAAQASNLGVPGHIAGARIMKKLVNREIFPKNFLEVYNRLRHLRNQAAHAQEFDLAPGEAERYLEIALSLTAQLRDVAGGKE